MIHSMINFLISNDGLAEQMRDSFEFHIIPMVNPDGVVLGNSRTNLQGKDMTKCFETKECHEVEVLKNYIKTFKEPPRMFVDMNGHDSQQEITLRSPECDEDAEDPSARNVNILLSMCEMFRLIKPSQYVCKPNAHETMHKDFGIKDSFMIKPSAFGYKNN